jgi:hypothetical protein
MARTRASVASAAGGSPSPIPWYPDDILSRIQKALGELADIEYRYEIERSKIHATAPKAGPRLDADATRRYKSEIQPCRDTLGRPQKELITAKILEEVRQSE